MKMETLLIVTSLIAVAYCQTLEWGVGQLPDPQKNPGKCGRYENKKSFVCDPNGILTRKEADTLDWILEAVYNNDTKCSCSAYYCEKNKGRGTFISLALVNKVKRSQGSDNSKEAILYDAELFLNDLQRTTWNHGTCDNDIIILYSAADSVVYTMTGDTPKLKVNPSVIGQVTSEHEQDILNGHIAGGLYHMILDYRNVLMGQYHTRLAKSQEPVGGASQPVWSLASIITLLIGFLLSTRF